MAIDALPMGLPPLNWSYTWFQTWNAGARGVHSARGPHLLNLREAG